MSALPFSPGSLVRARGREWIVLAGGEGETLRVRPISGSEEDQTTIHVGLEVEPVTDATFPPPTSKQLAGHDAALLLRDALLLSLRRGAGPFRGFGQIAVEPRAYQLVPLLMALKLDPVRLLIADDVGVGKTIEAALIARELLDRGDIERLTVLCPPHLVEQWVGELEARFHIHAVAVTAASANRLERSLPVGVSIFDQQACPFTVVSLDYIKSDRRREEFLRACPELVIVDEAHACAATGAGRHQRYDLLRALSESGTRHLVMLTATPHSGDESSFFRLLGLLHKDFARLAEIEGGERDRLREGLAKHFVQRRRPDIAEWKDGSLFPRRETKELTYDLSGAWETFFSAILDYCAAIVASAEGDERRQRLNFWGTLALMRCAASSPAAALKALRTRAGLEDPDEEAAQSQALDGIGDALPDDDVEPAAGNEDPAILALIAQAEQLDGQAGDPKLKVLTDDLTKLLKDGFSPVVFCRYIATAKYLGGQLRKKLRDVTVEVVTGELTSAERRDKVDLVGDATPRVLVATDCLSEGINLQDSFDAIIHYDLSWNPTRHEQREGRVDRFGQTRPIVRATLLYGANNPVDGAVLQVILRKAEKIRKELGVPVPVPDEGVALTQVLLKSMLLKRRGQKPPPDMKQMGLFEQTWDAAADKEKKSQTVFAQRRLKPEEVLPEWNKSLVAVGGEAEVQRFTERALKRLGAALSPFGKGFKTPLEALPEEVRERLAAAGLEGTLAISFQSPPAPRCRSVQRSHPLVSVLAETLLERTLGADGSVDLAATAADLGTLGRAGCWRADHVALRTSVAIVRLRHQLATSRAGRKSTELLVEEATALAWTDAAEPAFEGPDALALLTPTPTGDEVLAHVKARFIDQGLSFVEAHRDDLDAFARRRAEALLADHRRVREAADARGSYSVKAILPPDVIGLFVLLPRNS